MWTNTEGQKYRHGEVRIPILKVPLMKEPKKFGWFVTHNTFHEHLSIGYRIIIFT